MSKRKQRYDQKPSEKKKMSKSINDLPPELIIAILKRVNIATLKNAIFTCKLWKEIAETLPIWSLTIDYLHPNELKKTFLANTNRHFNQITLRNMKKVSEMNDFITLLKRHGHSVVNLLIKECSFKRSKHFVEMLNLMPNLEKLCMENNSGWPKSAPPPAELANSNKLKLMKVQGYVECFLTCLRGWQQRCAGVGCSREPKGTWVCKSISEYTF